MSSTADFELTIDELREVTRFAADCTRPVLRIFQEAAPDDQRPADALAAADAFADGDPRSNWQRTAATAAHRAGKEAANEAAGHAATAAGDAAASAYLHPLANATQVRHILGAAAHAARAGELWRGEDPVVAEYLLHAAVLRITPAVREVLERYPRAAGGQSRVDELLRKLDGLIRDPAPEPVPAEDPGPFFHGTRADLAPGDLLTPGWDTNYGSGKKSRHIYLTATRAGAPLAAVMASGEGRPRVYRVEPLGPIHDDPNVTDKKFPGNPTRSYRTTEALRVLEEVHDFELPDPAVVEHLTRNSAELRALGIEAMD